MDKLVLGGSRCRCKQRTTASRPVLRGKDGVGRTMGRFVCWLIGCLRPSNVLAYIRDGSALTSVHSKTLKLPCWLDGR